MKNIAFILLLIPSISFADDWSSLDSTLQESYTLLHIADWKQTLEITKSTEYEESNILLGKHPSADNINIYFAGTLFAHYQVSKAIKKPYRTYWQIAWILIELDCVRRNDRNGFVIGLIF